MKNRIIALALTSLMILTMGVALALADEPEELTIVIGRRSYDATTSYSEKHWVQEAEKACNIKINWIELPETTIKEQLASVMADANNLPDVFMCGKFMTDDLVSQNVSLWRPLTLEEIQTKVPNYYNFCEEYIDDWQEFITYPDGNIYVMMGSDYDSVRRYTYGLPYINYQWIENLGLEIPTTIDELYEVLVAFRDNDCNGNGDPNDEWPINVNQKYSEGQILNFAPLWGLPINNDTFYKIENNEVVGAVNTPAFREFLEFFYKLGQEGLLNLEGFSSTSDQYIAECDAMRSGVFCAWAPDYVITNDDNAMQYAGLPHISADGYEEAFIHRGYNLCWRNSFILSKSCKNVDAALRFWNYISDPTTSIEVFLGEEGIFWEFIDDNYNFMMVSCPDKELDPEGYAAHVQKLIDAGYGDYVEKGIILDGADVKHYNTVGCIGYGSVVLHSQSYDMTDLEDGNVWRIMYINDIVDRNGFAPPMPANIVPAEAQEEFDFMCDGLANIINGYVSSSILNGVTDDNWNAYLAKLDQYNYDYYLEFFNNKLHNTF